MVRRLRIASFALIAAFLLAAINPRPASAHASLVSSDPADGAVLDEAPGEVHLWFDEDISDRFSSVQLFDASGRPIVVGELRGDPDDSKKLTVALPDGLEDDVYSILWKAFSDSDGHFSQGLLVFGVGAAADLSTASVASADAAAAAAPEVFLRWLNFGLLAGLVGAIAIIQLVLQPAKRTSKDEPGIAGALGAAQRRIMAWAVLCIILLLVAGVGLLLWQSYSLFASQPEGSAFSEVVSQSLGQTRLGTLWLIRQGILLALLALGITLYLRARRQSDDEQRVTSESSSDRLAWTAWALLSLSLLGLQSLVGHAAAVSPNTSLALVADMLHLLSASLWVGGLVALAIGLLPLLWSNQKDFLALARAGWRPFGKLAAISVGLLVATGLYSAGRQVASIDALITTLYGQVLLGKIGLMLAVGAFGLLNSMLLHPKVAAPVGQLLRRPAGWKPLSLRRLPVLVMAEATLGITVLLVTGLLTASPAPRDRIFTISPEEIPDALSETVDDIVITLFAKPNRPGNNVFTVFAASSRRPAVAEISRVIVRFKYLDQELGRESVIAEEIEPGRYLVAGNQLNLAGPWLIDVAVRRQGLEDSVASFNWMVAPPGEAQPVVVSKRPIEGPLTIAAALALLLLLLITSLVWLLGSRSVPWSAAPLQTESEINHGKPEAQTI